MSGKTIKTEASIPYIASVQIGYREAQKPPASTHHAKKALLMGNGMLGAKRNTVGGILKSQRHNPSVPIFRATVQVPADELIPVVRDNAARIKALQEHVLEENMPLFEEIKQIIVDYEGTDSLEILQDFSAKELRNLLFFNYTPSRNEDQKNSLIEATNILGSLFHESLATRVNDAYSLHSMLQGLVRTYNDKIAQIEDLVASNTLHKNMFFINMNQWSEMLSVAALSEINEDNIVLLAKSLLEW